MKDFVTLDVETANGNPSSICSIGCVKVKDGKIVDTYYSLVHPEPDYYWRKFTAIHGLSDDDTWNARPFDQVWREIVDWSEGLPVVAHNAGFDYGCVSAACRIYRLDPPTPFLCTLKASQRNIKRSFCTSFSLPNLCAFLGVPFSNHHNALADAQGVVGIVQRLEELTQSDFRDM